MPVWEACYVIVIASKTGWTEDFIRHRLPLSRGRAYYHAIRMMAGERCRWPGRVSAIGRHVDRVMRWLRSLSGKTTPPLQIDE